VADAALVAKADRTLKEAAKSYAAFFRALEMGVLTHAQVMPWNYDAMDLDLARPQSLAEGMSGDWSAYLPPPMA